MKKTNKLSPNPNEPDQLIWIEVYLAITVISKKSIPYYICES